MKYNPSKIEKKWQKHWEENKIFKDYSRKEKFYVLDMFPYPSGSGLHVGHPKGYIATDVVARFEQLRGKSVLHPMGWDAFGLPAENYALKNKQHPKIATEENVRVFKKQLEKIGFTYDWDREINTTNPEYYRWTQWIFLKMFEKGLAYESYEPINWCPSCKTGLANEDLDNGKCERCGSEVEQKPMRQWVLKMTEYADRLLADLDTEGLDWEKSIVDQQKNWIGRSEGAEIKFNLQPTTYNLQPVTVFTTRVDTIFGCTYIVLAPEHEIIQNSKFKIQNYGEVEEYIKQAKKKTVMQRTELAKEKTGVKLEGITAINPFNGEAVPVFVADYVLGSYGTGAVMAVPAHDERDFEFAKKYNLPVRRSIIPYIRLEGDDAPRSDEKIHRFSAVTAIIKHWEQDKYLFVNFRGNVWGMIGGSVEDHDAHLDEAILREAQEETVYKNYEISGILFEESYSRGYKTRKSREEECHEKIYVLKLLNDEKSDDIAEEEGIIEYAWLTKEDALKKEMLTHHRKYFETFLAREASYVEDGALIDSGDFTGLKSENAREQMMDWLEKTGNGKRTVKYKMRDWVFSRQRYWGEPIPIVHCEKCGAVGVPEEDLPVRLPEVKHYEPTGTGESPLAGIEDWVSTKCPKCGGPAKRETNTMPQWAGSSWYYLAYVMRQDSNFQLPTSKFFSEWLPVDLYVGGAEHATRHLLYARFWHKFLYDIGVVPTKEPFKKLVHVGLINAEDGRKMSKRWNNVINPDDVIAEFGADSLRLYEMFMGPFTQSIAWNTEGVSGVRRFLEKIWRLQEKLTTNDQRPTTGDGIENLLHKTIKKVTEDIENFRFNTAISSLMILVNALGDANDANDHANDTNKEILSREVYKKLLLLLSPFAPHIAEELWEKMGHTTSIFLERWPAWDSQLIVDETITMVVQVNGKVRDTLVVPSDIDEARAKELALASEKVQKFIAGKAIRKVIFVKGKLVSIVV